MVVISRSIRFFILLSLVVTSSSSLLGMQSLAARLLGRASRVVKPTALPIRPATSFRPSGAFKPTFTQPKTFTQQTTYRASIPAQPQSWWQRFTSWARTWQMPRFNLFKSTAKRVSMFGAQRLLPLAGAGAATLAATTVQAQSVMPAFTQENIDTFPELKEEFLAHIKEHPEYFDDGAKPEITAAMLHFFTKYPELVYSVSSVVSSRLSSVHTNILDLFLHKISADYAKDDLNVLTKMEIDTFTAKAHELGINEVIKGDYYENKKLKNVDRVVHYIPAAGSTFMINFFEKIKSLTKSAYDRETYFERLANRLAANMPSLLPHALKFILETDLETNYDISYDAIWYDFIRKSTLKDSLAAYYKQHPEVIYKITPAAFKELMSRMRGTWSGLSKTYVHYLRLEWLFNILLANLLRPEIFAAISDNDVYIDDIVYYHNTPEITQAILKNAVETDNLLLGKFLKHPSQYICSHTVWSHHISKGHTFKEAILRKVAYDPSLIATMPIANALVIAPYLTDFPEIVAAMKERSISQKEFEKATPEQLKALLRNNPSRADTFVQYALQAGNKTLLDIIKNPQTWGHPDACQAHKTYVKDQVIQQGAERALEFPGETSAILFGHLSPEEQQKLARTLPDTKASTVFEYLDRENRQKLVTILPEERVPGVFEHLTTPGAQQGLVAALPDARVSRLCQDLTPEAQQRLVTALPHSRVSGVFEGLTPERQQRLVTELPDETVGRLFEHLTPEQQKRMEKAVEQQLGISVESSATSVVEKALRYHTKFPFLTKCTKDNHSSTATEKHYCANRERVLALIKNHTKQLTPEMRAMYLNLFKKEQEEVAQGNYVFYHAQQWPWHFKADIYKQFMNLTQQTQVGDDYQFLRFGNNREHNNYYVKDALFMNAALFGNAQRYGACSFYYLLKNHDYSGGRNEKFSTQWMAQQFKLQPYYEKHKTEFEKLEQLHEKASKHGNCLLISIPQDKVNKWVHTTDYGARVSKVWTKKGDTSKAGYVIDALKENPHDVHDNGDLIEYAMPMDGDVLDPQKGPRIYAFNNADPKIMADYRAQRDQLFATIKQEMEAAKVAQQQPTTTENASAVPTTPAVA